DARAARRVLLRGGEAQLREAGGRALAELFEPRGGAGRAAPHERFEVGDVAVGDVHAAAGSVRSQSYPFSSSSSARSSPPDFTIRPAASTCTRSGWICVRIR